MTNFSHREKQRLIARPELYSFGYSVRNVYSMYVFHSLFLHCLRCSQSCVANTLYSFRSFRPKESPWTASTAVTVLRMCTACMNQHSMVWYGNVVLAPLMQCIKSDVNTKILIKYNFLKTEGEGWLIYVWCGNQSISYLFQYIYTWTTVSILNATDSSPLQMTLVVKYYLLHTSSDKDSDVSGKQPVFSSVCLFYTAVLLTSPYTRAGKLVTIFDRAFFGEGKQQNQTQKNESHHDILPSSILYVHGNHQVWSRSLRQETSFLPIITE
jgi:hypothetical protein